MQVKVDVSLSRYADRRETDDSVKVYNTQFRKWGIRKNLKRQEALELAVGQLDDSSTVSSSSSSSVFWPNNRDVEYAARIDRHLRNIKRRPGSTFPHVKFGTKVGGAGHPPRRLRGPDMLEKVESASYYFQMYITKNHEPDTWFRHCPCYGEQGNFSSHFLRGLDRLSRNEQPRQAFKDINLAFDELKDTVSWNHPMVYMRLMDAIASSGMYPKSEVCKTICRLLSDHVRRLSIIVHGPNHPLNHAWGEAMCVSGDSSESFILGVAKSLFKKCISRRGRTPVEAYDISECIPSDARDLDEETLRGSLTKPIPLSDLPKAQEARLALSELLISQDRMAEGCHYYRVAMAFQDDDPVRRAAKTFWMAELQWRTGITWGSIDTLKRALAYAEEESEAEGGDGAATDLKEEIEALLRRRLYMLAVKEKAKHVAAGHKCPAAFLELEEAPESETSETDQDEAELKCPAEYVRLEKPPVIETGKPKG